MPEPVKKKVKCDDDAEARVSDYMRKQNRPYSLINIFDNLRGVYPKPVLQQALDQLSSEPQAILVCKNYGAQKFYYCIQSIYGDCSVDTVKSVELELQSLKGVLNQLTCETAEALAACPVSDAALLADNKKLLAELKTVQSAIDELQASAGQVSQQPGELEECVKRFGRVKQESERRQRLCLRILDHLAESLYISRNDIAQELGVELCM